jgi:asparagine synthase (glutamine-hydrolysing)
LLARARFWSLVRQLRIWALQKRKPWWQLLLEAARGFCPRSLSGIPDHARPVPWLDARFAERQREALSGYESRTKFWGALPSFQENLSALEMLRRQLASSELAFDPPFEKRYPYLDRDLLAFVFAVPREQVVRPGQRRSLMRRALRGIVPDGVLERKRKAFISRSPWMHLRANWAEFAVMSEQMVSGELGIVRPEVFVREVQQACHGGQGHLVRTLRTIALEKWLKALVQRGVVTIGAYQTDREVSGLHSAMSASGGARFQSRFS